jgi:hypothetical protein
MPGAKAMKIVRVALWLVAVGAMFWAWKESRVLAHGTFPGYARLVDFVIAMVFMFPMYFLIVLPIARRFGKLGDPR